MPNVPHRRLLALVLATLLVATACGDEDDAASGGDRPTVAVTTTVLGDVVMRLVGDQADVVTIMPLGASPHDFQASAREAAVLVDADAIIVNGGGFEEGLLSVVDAAEADGVPVIVALDLLEGGAEGDDAHADEDEGGHDDDAHFFTDPLAMAEAVEGMASALGEVVPVLDVELLEAATQSLVADLTTLHEEVDALLSVVPAERRVLVTDHDVFSSFAERYGFEVVGTVIPSGSTSDGVSGGGLARLAEVLRAEGVRAVFTEQTSSPELAETLAAEVGDEVAIVSLFAESLGPDGSGAATYSDMMLTNAERIADALGP